MSRIPRELLPDDGFWSLLVRWPVTAGLSVDEGASAPPLAVTSAAVGLQEIALTMSQTTRQNTPTRRPVAISTRDVSRPHHYDRLTRVGYDCRPGS